MSVVKNISKFREDGANKDIAPTTIERVTYTWNGEAKTTDIMPPFKVSVNTNETLKLRKLYSGIYSGTSHTIKIQKNGSDLSGFTSFEVTGSYTSMSTLDPDDQTLADGDVLQIVRTAVSGTPMHPTVVLEFERSR
jgi:hypothetical protein